MIDVTMTSRDLLGVGDVERDAHLAARGLARGELVDANGAELLGASKKACAASLRATASMRLASLEEDVDGITADAANRGEVEPAPALFDKLAASDDCGQTR